MDELRIGYSQGRYTLVTVRGDVLQVLEAGAVCELEISGEWCRVQVCSGGYRGWYYETEAGKRGRLAVSMRARLCERVCERVSEPVLTVGARAVLSPAVVLAVLQWYGVSVGRELCRFPLGLSGLLGPVAVPILGAGSVPGLAAGDSGQVGGAVKRSGGGKQWRECCPGCGGC